MTRPHSVAADDAAANTMGLARLAKMVYTGGDCEPLAASLTSRAATNPADAGALMDLSMLSQLSGWREQGLALQARALHVSRVYRCVHGTGAGTRVLALFAPGDFMANTPLDFLLDGSDVTVYYAYVTPGTTSAGALPDHDVAFLGVAESDTRGSILGELADVAATWPRPMLNSRGRTIAEMSRDRVWQRFRSSGTVVAPRNARATRAELAKVAVGDVSVQELLPDAEFPVIARPIDSHAGNGLVRIVDAAALLVYLGEIAGDHFYIAPYVDYRSGDGRFRKYRIVFVQGRAYLAHLAISSDWMVHYLNAGMHETGAKRDEEAACMAQFDDDFASRHTLALAEVAAQIPLDYFAIDCAETADGRLLLFEAGTGMIVHAMDAADVFPYKRVQMRKIFSAFLDMLAGAAGAGVA